MQEQLTLLKTWPLSISSFMLEGRHALVTSFHPTETQWQQGCPDLSGRKVWSLFLIWQQVHPSCQATMVSEDLSYLTQTSTTVNHSQMTSTPPAWQSPFPASPQQGRATVHCWSPAWQSPMGTTALQHWRPPQAPCSVPLPCHHSCHHPFLVIPLILCLWVCLIHTQGIVESQGSLGSGPEPRLGNQVEAKSDLLPRGSRSSQLCQDTWGSLLY
jgi:hypothetical protein